jgi:hypothetical protein
MDASNSLCCSDSNAVILIALAARSFDIQCTTLLHCIQSSVYVSYSMLQLENYCDAKQ